MNTKAVILFTISVTLFSCNINSKSEFQDSEVITIDVLETLKNKGDLKLSELADKVELIELDSRTEAYLRGYRGLYVGEKYIVVGAIRNNDNKILLFSRDGSYIRTIGRYGKGPGEYTELQGIVLDPNENYIVAMEMRPKRLHLYDTAGNHIRSKNLNDIVPYYTIQGMHFADDKHFAVALSRPGGPDDQVFARVVFFNLDFEIVERYLPITDPDDLSMYLLQYVWFGKSDGGFYYCEGIRDTVYYFDLETPPQPKYYFHISEDKVTEESQRKYDPIVDRYDRKNFLWGVFDLPNHLLAYGKGSNDVTFLISYDKKKEEAVSCQYRDPCDLADHEKRPFIENDIFGLEPVYIRAYEPDPGFIVMDFDPAFAQETIDVDCFRKLNVKDTKLRNRIADIIENATGEENKVLILMKLKK